jgi:hypothetical protein
MKKVIYAAGLLLLPIAYIAVQKLNGQPIDWAVLLLILVILSPLLLWKQIGGVEKTFNSMTPEEQKRLLGMPQKR